MQRVNLLVITVIVGFLLAVGKVGLADYFAIALKGEAGLALIMLVVSVIANRTLSWESWMQWLRPAHAVLFCGLPILSAFALADVEGMGNIIRSCNTEVSDSFEAA